MRPFSTSQRDILQSSKYDVHLRVEVQSSSGAYRDIGGLGVGSWVEAARWDWSLDQPVPEMLVSLRRDHGPISSGQSLAPLDENSTLNTIPSSSGYSPVIDVGRGFRVYTAATTPGGNPTSSQYDPVFYGEVDDIDWAQSPIGVRGRSKIMGSLNDRWIESSGNIYGSDAGTPIQDVIQSLIDDHTDLGISLWTPTSPGFLISPQYIPDKQPVLRAIGTLAQMIGWDVREHWSSTDDDFRLKFYEPDRAPSTTDFVFGPDSYLDVKAMSISREDVRNSVSVLFGPTTNRQQLIAASTVSEDDYGRKWMEIQEASNSAIQSSGEANTLAQSALADLKDPPALHTIGLPYWWPAELQDYYGFSPNDIHYDTLQEWGVYGVSHDLSENKHRTDIRVRGKPAGQYSQWLVYTGGGGGESRNGIKVVDWSLRGIPTTEASQQDFVMDYDIEWEEDTKSFDVACTFKQATSSGLAQFTTTRYYGVNLPSGDKVYSGTLLDVSGGSMESSTDVEQVFSIKFDTDSGIVSDVFSQTGLLGDFDGLRFRPHTGTDLGGLSPLYAKGVRLPANVRSAPIVGIRAVSEDSTGGEKYPGYALAPGSANVSFTQSTEPSGNILLTVASTGAGDVTGVTEIALGGITVTSQTGPVPAVGLDIDTLTDDGIDMVALDRFAIHSDTGVGSRKIAPANMRLDRMDNSVSLFTTGGFITAGDGLIASGATVSAYYAANASNLIGAPSLLVGDSATTDRILVTEGGASAVVRQAELSQLPFAPPGNYTEDNVAETITGAWTFDSLITGTAGYAFSGVDATAYAAHRILGGTNNPGLFVRATEASKLVEIYASGTVGTNQVLSLGAGGASGVVDIVAAGATVNGTLDVTGTGSTPLALTRTTTSNVAISVTNNDDTLYFGMNSSELFAVNDTADLGSTPAFTVNPTSGNTEIAGTLDVTGNLTQGNWSVLSSSGYIQNTAAGTAAKFFRVKSTGGDFYVGIENSAGSFFTGAGAYESVLYSPSNNLWIQSPAVGLSGTLDVTGVITATGGTIQKGGATSSMQVTGGTSAGLGANILLYGESHATLAGDTRLRSSTTVWLDWDNSAGEATLTGDLTLSSGDLDVTGGETTLSRASTARILTVTNASAGGNSEIFLRDGSTDRYRIGTTGSGADFRIYDAVGSAAVLTYNQSTTLTTFSGPIAIAGSPASSGALRLTNNDSVNWNNFAGTGNLGIYLGLDDELTVNTVFRPFNDGATNLGTATNRWDVGYFTSLNITNGLVTSVSEATDSGLTIDPVAGSVVVGINYGSGSEALIGAATNLATAPAAIDALLIGEGGITAATKSIQFSQIPLGIMNDLGYAQVGVDETITGAWTFPDTTDIGVTAQSYDTLAATDWVRGVGTHVFVNAATSTGDPSTDRGYWFTMGRRDTLSGYAGLYLEFGNTLWLGARDDNSTNGAPTWTEVSNVGHVHSAADITSGTLLVARGGTGRTTVPGNDEFLVSTGSGYDSSTGLTWNGTTLTATNLAGIGTNITGVNADGVQLTAIVPGTKYLLMTPDATGAAALNVENADLFWTTSTDLLTTVNLDVTGTLDVTGIGTFDSLLNANADIRITNAQPTIDMWENDADADEGHWKFAVAAGYFYLQARNDANNGGVNALTFSRTSGTIVNQLEVGSRLFVNSQDSIILRATAIGATALQWDHRLQSGGNYELRSVNAGSTVVTALSVAHATGDATFVGDVRSDSLHIGGSAYGAFGNRFTGDFTSNGVSTAAAHLSIGGTVIGAPLDTSWLTVFGSGAGNGGSVTTQSGTEDVIGAVSTLRLGAPTITNNLWDVTLGEVISTTSNGTVNTTLAHGWTGSTQKVYITGHSDANYNGWWTITVVDTDTFTLNGWAGTASGTGGNVYEAGRITRAATLYINDEPTAGKDTGIDEAWGIYTTQSARLGSVTSASIVPVTNATYALGSATNRWNTIYGTALDITGEFLAGDGSAAAPAFAFSAQPQNGFYRPGSNQMSWAISGGERIRFTTSPGEGFIFGGAQDTNLYRSAANTLKTDDAFEVGGTLDVTGIATFSGKMHLNNAAGNEMLLLKDTGGAGVLADPYIGFDDSAGTRQGYVGFGSTSNQHLYAVSDIGDIRLVAKTGVRMYHDGTQVLTTTATGVVANLDLNVYGGLDVTGVITAGDGSVSAPGYSFGSETGTGLYASASQINWAVNGVRQMYLNAGGLALIDPNETNFRMYETDAATDEGNWRLVASGGDLYIQAINDAGSVFSSALRFQNQSGVVSNMFAITRLTIQQASTVFHRMQNTNATDKQWDFRIQDSGAFEIRTLTDAGTTETVALTMTSLGTGVLRSKFIGNTYSQEGTEITATGTQTLDWDSYNQVAITNVGVRTINIDDGSMQDGGHYCVVIDYVSGSTTDWTWTPTGTLRWQDGAEPVLSNATVGDRTVVTFIKTEGDTLGFWATATV